MDPNFINNLFTIPHSDLSNAVTGGVLISLASSLYYILFGGILGMSGMIGSIVKFITREATKAKIIVVIGVIFSSALINYLVKNQHTAYHPYDVQSFTQETSVLRLIVSGALVGMGTELGNGCTSGHGLCGLPRFSLRSFVAVMVFLITAIVTATGGVHQHLPPTPEQIMNIEISQNYLSPQFYLTVASILAVASVFIGKISAILQKIALLVIGFVFGSGLMIAGMSQRSKIYGFLQLDANWDPSLLFVLMTGVMLNVITFSIMRYKIKTPYFNEKLEDPKGHLTVRLIVGAFLFGIGWGLGGLCPGPFLLSIPNSVKITVFWGVPFLLVVRIISLIFPQNPVSAQHKVEHQKHEKPQEVHTKSQ